MATPKKRASISNPLTAPVTKWVEMGKPQDKDQFIQIAGEFVFTEERKGRRCDIYVSNREHNLCDKLNEHEFRAVTSGLAR